MEPVSDMSLLSVMATSREKVSCCVYQKPPDHIKFEVSGLKIFSHHIPHTLYPIGAGVCIIYYPRWRDVVEVCLECGKHP